MYSIYTRARAGGAGALSERAFVILDLFEQLGEVPLPKAPASPSLLHYEGPKTIREAKTASEKVAYIEAVPLVPVKK